MDGRSPAIHHETLNLAVLHPILQFFQKVHGGSAKVSDFTGHRNGAIVHDLTDAYPYLLYFPESRRHHLENASNASEERLGAVENAD